MSTIKVNKISQVINNSDIDERVSTLSSSLVKRGAGRTGQERSRTYQRWLRVLSPFLLILLWELSTRLGTLDYRFFPAPSMIFGSFLNMLGDGSLFNASLITLRRLFLGFVIGAFLGVVVGLWLGLSSWSRSVFEPWIQLTYPIPKLAIYPLLMIIVGMGEPAIVTLLAIATFYIVVISTISGVISINKTYIDVGKDSGANFIQFFFTIALPASLPVIFTSIEVAMGIAFIVVIAAEFLGSSSGLGYIIWTSWEVFALAPMYVSIVVISLLGFLSVLAVRALGDYLMPWRNHR